MRRLVTVCSLPSIQIPRTASGISRLHLRKKISSPFGDSSKISAKRLFLLSRSRENPKLHEWNSMERIDHPQLLPPARPPTNLLMRARGSSRAAGGYVVACTWNPVRMETPSIPVRYCLLRIPTSVWAKRQWIGSKSTSVNVSKCSPISTFPAAHNAASSTAVGVGVFPKAWECFSPFEGEKWLNSADPLSLAFLGAL